MCEREGYCQNILRPVVELRGGVKGMSLFGDNSEDEKRGLLRPISVKRQPPDLRSCQRRQRRHIAFGLVYTTDALLPTLQEKIAQNNSCSLVIW